ncbi:hypothetical protein [Aerosakkonema funiforme]|uniref:hypothetical protein n=1 Tax=Aerosakkonema funiforme TaxID=1246630 RepID=UPI0035BC5744
MLTYQITKNQINTIRQWGKQYCSSVNSDELGGFILTNGQVTFESNYSGSPQRSFLCDWHKYPIEDVVGIWHTHPGYGGEFLSPADYEFSQWYGRPILMYAPLYEPQAWDWFDPTGVVNFSHLSKWLSERAGYYHPSDCGQFKFHKTAREFEDAERQIFEAYRKYISELQRAKEMMKKADEKAIASLNFLAEQCQDYRVKTALTDQVTQIQISQYAHQFLQEF